MQSEFVNMPKTKRGEATLEKICRAAEVIFGKKGYYNTSINEIATEASVAPGTIYIYFVDKYSLYRHLLSQYSHDIRKAISIATKQSSTRYEAERNGLKCFLELIREKEYMYNIIWESLYVDKNLFIEYYETFSKKYVQRIKDAQNHNEMIDVDPEVTSYVLMGISNFIGLKYIIFEDKTDLDYVVDEVMKVVYSGLFTSK